MRRTPLDQWMEVLPLTAVLTQPGSHLWVQPTLGIKQHREGMDGCSISQSQGAGLCQPAPHPRSSSSKRETELTLQKSRSLILGEPSNKG